MRIEGRAVRALVDLGAHEPPKAYNWTSAHAELAEFGLVEFDVDGWPMLSENAQHAVADAAEWPSAGVAKDTGLSPAERKRLRAECLAYLEHADTEFTVPVDVRFYVPGEALSATYTIEYTPQALKYFYRRLGGRAFVVIEGAE